MADLLVLVLLLAFFTLAVAFVRGCERIIGPDLEAEATTEPETEVAEAAAA